MTEIIAFLAAITAFVVSVTTLIKTFKNGKQIQEVHLSINSRMDELLNMAKTSSFAAGVKSEVDKK